MTDFRYAAASLTLIVFAGSVLTAAAAVGLLVGGYVGIVAALVAGAGTFHGLRRPAGTLAGRLVNA